MKFILSNNINDIGYGMETRKEEIQKFKSNSVLAEQIKRAYEAAKIIFEQYPEFKQVTLDTVNDEEREMIKQSKKSKSKN